MPAAAPQPTPPLEAATPPASFVAAPPIAPQNAPQRERERSRSPRRRAHQPLRVSPWLTVVGAVLLCQVVVLLWLQGMAMSARNQATKLDREVKNARLQISRAQDRIARTVAEAPQIEQWASQGGWKLAEQKEFDDVRDMRPYISAQELTAKAPRRKGRKERRGNVE